MALMPYGGLRESDLLDPSASAIADRHTGRHGLWSSAGARRLLLARSKRPVIRACGGCTDSSEETVALSTTRDGAIWLFARATPATVESAGHAMLAAPGGPTTAWGARWSAAGDVEVIEALEALPKPNPPWLIDVVAADDGGALVLAGAPALVLSSASPRPDLFPKRTEGNTDKPRLHLLRSSRAASALAAGIKSDKTWSRSAVIRCRPNRRDRQGRGDPDRRAKQHGRPRQGLPVSRRLDREVA